VTGPGAIVVVGAGVAGVIACDQLRVLGYQGRLTLLGAEDALPYERPPLSKDFLQGRVGTPGIALRAAGWYAEQRVELRLGTVAERVVPNEGRVLVSAGPAEPADAVLLATGGRPRRLGVPGGDHPAVTVLRTVADAEALRARLLPGVRVGVVGGGLIGAEVAATAVGLGCAVTLVETSGRPLERVLGRWLADHMHRAHGRHGVRVVRAAVSEVGPDGEGVRLHLTNGQAVACDVVVVGVGIEPSLELATGAGLAVDGGVLVDAGHRSSHPRLFAAGDVARRQGPDGPLPRVEHWDGAVAGGRAAAAGMLGLAPPPPRAPWFWSDRYGVRLEVVGELTGPGRTVLRGDPGSGSFLLLAVRDGRCVGAAAVDRPGEMTAVRRLVDAGVQVGANTLADEAVDLRALARAARRPA
jgi:NADPH-dependent 2,4-dienoyl-CoA reductase/sulfur reductase-like enzyme